MFKVKEKLKLCSLIWILNWGRTKHSWCIFYYCKIEYGIDLNDTWLHQISHIFGTHFHSYQIVLLIMFFINIFYLNYKDNRERLYAHTAWLLWEHCHSHQFARFGNFHVRCPPLYLLTPYWACKDTATANMFPQSKRCPIFSKELMMGCRIPIV